MADLARLLDHGGVPGGRRRSQSFFGRPELVSASPRGSPLPEGERPPPPSRKTSFLPLGVRHGERRPSLSMTDRSAERTGDRTSITSASAATEGGDEVGEEEEEGEGEGEEEGRGGNLTEQEMKEFLDIFNLVDRSKREFITESQLGVLLETLGVSATPEEVSQMVKEIDEDGNGQIEFDEFVAVMDKRSSSGDCTPEEIKAAFRHFVVREAPPGMIHPEDMKRCFRRHCSTLTRAQVDDLVAMTEPNAQGFIDYETYVNTLMSVQ